MANHPRLHFLIAWSTCIAFSISFCEYLYVRQSFIVLHQQGTDVQSTVYDLYKQCTNAAISGPGALRSGTGLGAEPMVQCHTAPLCVGHPQQYSLCINSIDFCSVIWSPDHSDGIFLDQSAALHCFYYYTRILMHRPFIPGVSSMMEPVSRYVVLDGQRNLRLLS